MDLPALTLRPFTLSALSPDQAADFNVDLNPNPNPNPSPHQAADFNVDLAQRHDAEFLPYGTPYQN